MGDHDGSRHAVDGTSHVTPEKMQILREKAARGESWESTTDADVALLLAEIDAVARREAVLREALVQVQNGHRPVPAPDSIGEDDTEWCEADEELWPCRTERIVVRALLSEVPG